MNKKLTLMSLCFGIAMSANAQQQLFPIKPDQAKHLRLINSIIQRNTATKNAHQKPTAIRQRVIAQSMSGEDMTDSFHYTYSSTKGSYYDYNKILQPGYSTDFFPEELPIFLSAEVNTSKDVLADNIATFYTGEEPEESIAYYNLSGSIDSSIKSSGDDVRKTFVTYNAEGRIIKFHQDFFTSGTLSGGNLRKTAYSGSEIVTDSTFNRVGSSWNLTGRSIYSYDAEGNITALQKFTTSEDFYELYEFRYDASGRLRATEGSMVLGSTSIPTVTDTVGYTDGIDYITFYQYAYSGGFGASGFRLFQYPGTHAGPDSLRIDNFDEDVWVHQGTGHFTYNEFDNPAELELIAAETEETEEDMMDVMRFYYETYDDGVSSTDDVTLKNQFGIYPNPFVDNLNIEYKGTDKARMQLQLSDISGRVIFNGNKRLNAGINTINLPQLPAGAYILVIKNELGASFTQKIIRK